MTIKQALIVVLSGLVIMICLTPSWASNANTYKYFINEGKHAIERRDIPRALHCFKWAYRINPQASEPLDYLNNVPGGKAVLDQEVIYASLMASRIAPPRKFQDTQALIDHINLVKRSLDKMIRPAVTVPPVAMVPISHPVTEAVKKDEPTLTATKTYTRQGKKAVEDVILLADIVKSTIPRPTLRLEIGRTIILEGKNIQKFLVVSGEIIGVKRLSADRLQVVAVMRGSTIFHVWDDAGRTTIYMETLFPDSSGDNGNVRSSSFEHAAPFRFSYSNNWSGYYMAPRGSRMKRQGLSFNENVGVNGETPYGYLDSSASLSGFNPVRDIPAYTLGLTGIPVPGTRAMSVRLFDSTRSLSPLSMPGAHLRGAFVDLQAFKEAVGFSVTHGQLQPTFGFSMLSSAQQSYLDAFKVVLFPNDRDHHYAFNYARGSGADRNTALTAQAYSVEGVYRINKVLFNAELARDSRNTASIGGMSWGGKGWDSALSFKNINKNFTTVTSAPSGQGTTSMLWTSNINAESYSAGTMLDVTRQRLYTNPNNPDALDYDANANINIPLSPKLAFASRVRYVDTAGDILPRHSMGLNTGLTRNIEVWGGRNGSVYVSGGYQESTYPDNPTSDYHSYDAATGVNLSLTKNLSWYLSYQYSWLIEGLSDFMSNPMATTTGLSYNRQFMERLSGNFSLSYRNEQSTQSLNSFMAGEDSVGLSGSLTYNPKNDLSYFIDSNVQNVWSKAGQSTSYTSMDLRMGMRGIWGTSLVWDPKGAVSGVVYKDKNGNGKKDEGEPGLPDIKVKAGEKEAITDKDGRYRIEVKGKRVNVTPLMETIPTGYIFSTPSFFKVDILHGIARVVDFGLTTQSGIYGIVFVDKNGNNQPDRGDQFLQHVKILLDGKKTIMSDSQGTYFFQKVSEGGHNIAIDMKTLPQGLIPLIKIKNDIVVTEGINYIFHIPMRQKAVEPPIEPQRSEK